MTTTTEELEPKERSLELQLITRLRNDVTTLQLEVTRLRREGDKTLTLLEGVVTNQTLMFRHLKGGSDD